MLLSNSNLELGAGSEKCAPALEQKVAFLRNPASYGGPITRVEVRETNMSWVFLAGDLVFKLKKPVRLPYLDFSILAKRRAACFAEVALNRRLAPGIYLGAVPLCFYDGKLSIGGGGAIVDWLVKMQRLDRERMLDRLIEKGHGYGSHADALAATLIGFYSRAAAVFFNPIDYLRQWIANLQQNRAVLLNPRFNLPQGPIRHLDRVLQGFLAENRDLFLERLRRRRIIDGHGDLRPEHIWLGDEVKIIDCLEFSARLRSIDPIEELAYLDLECAHLGDVAFGASITRHILRALHDEAPLSLFYFYRCYRAMLRARLSISHLAAPKPRTPEKWRPKTLAYLKLADADARRLERAFRKPEGRQAANFHAAV